MNATRSELVKMSLFASLFMGTACASAPLVPEAQGEFRPTGVIQRGAHGASFNASRVVSPNISLAKHADGSWSGQFALAGNGTTVPLDVSVSESAIRGVGFVLTRSTPSPGLTVFDGLFDQKRFHFEVSHDAFTIHTTRYTAAYGTPRAEGDQLFFGENKELILQGAATDVTAPQWPEMGLALVAAFY